MSARTCARSILKSVKVYEDLLQSATGEQFQQTPAPDVWSLSEVFSHIFQANIGSLIAAEKCAIGTAQEVLKPTPLVVKLILFFGKLPPGKLKAPESLAAITKKMDREEAHNLIIKFRKRLEEVVERIPKATKTQKYKHPRLGYLNAVQWLRFIEIHTKHHEKQLIRVSKLLNKI